MAEIIWNGKTQRVDNTFIISQIFGVPSASTWFNRGGFMITKKERARRKKIKKIADKSRKRNRK